MKPSQLPIFAILLLASACSDGSPPHGHNVTAPAFVYDLAERQLDASSPTHEEDFRRFIYAFLMGYIQPQEGSIASTDSIFMAGLRAGQRSRQKDHSAISEVLAGFGYAPVKAAGAFSFGFEEMSFLSEEDGSEKWWVLGTLSAPESILGPCKRGTLTGYLSSMGRHGHLGAYKHQVIVQEFRCDA